MKSRGAFKNSLKTAVILAALISFAASCLQQAQKPDLTITAVNTHSPASERSSDKNYGTFLHSVPEHHEVTCDSCHQRERGLPDLKFAGHDSCIGCHMNEFTNAKSGICATCHSDLQSASPAMNPFPAKFNEGFNMKFDHAAHTRGDARPAQGCASCHQSAGASQTIPVGVQAHANCFTCHTPESNIGSCTVCHEVAPYTRTPSVTAVIKAVFRHSDHSLRQGVSCAECHTVRASAPQSQQVSAPVAVQHFAASAVVSCRTCHNDRRAFGEKDFSNCARCHSGSGFDMLPPGLGQN
ncbi:hypothetical protein BH18ACI3_BH18ACI3_02210 [soil metagenome]